MLDTEPIYKRSWQEAGRELGYDLNDSFYFTLTGRTNVACEELLGDRFGPNFPIQEFRERWQRLWKEEALNSGLQAKPGLAELLRFLDEHKISKAVATSSDRNYANFTLSAAGLLDRFETIVTGEEVVNGKPAPDIYLEAARRLGAEPARCVALEDSDNGVLAAAAAGMKVLLVPDLKAPSDAARRAASQVLESLHEAMDVITSWL